jgi:hypothetical protein
MSESSEISIEIVTDRLPLERLRSVAADQFGDLVKAVVDISQSVMAIGGELHADEEALLIEQGSKQSDLWGINLYPAEYGQDGWLEFDSMINLRPSQGNRSRGVDDPHTRELIAKVVDHLVTDDE